MKPDSVLSSVEIPSAERRAYSTPVAPPTGKFCAAYLPAFGIGWSINAVTKISRRSLAPVFCEPDASDFRLIRQ